MWNSLSLAETEAVTLHIDDLLLNIPNLSIIGKFAMKKIISTVDVDKFLKTIWNTSNSMETTLVGENMYLFSFVDIATKERIFNNQPWNFRGAVILMDLPQDHGGPADFNQFMVPFSIQLHGLPYRAMNRQIGNEIGSLIGEVLEVTCNSEGIALGRCLRVRVRLDIRQPLIRWTNIKVAGVSSKVLLWYEKLTDFCFICGRIDHLTKHCNHSYPGSLCHYGPWLRADEKSQLP